MRELLIWSFLDTGTFGLFVSGCRKALGFCFSNSESETHFFSREEFCHRERERERERVGIQKIIRV
jgi:hypothetical protein